MLEEILEELKKIEKNKITYPECLCCYESNFPVSKRMLETCQAEIKHNICYNCYKISSSKKCFYCFPLDRGNFKTRGNGNFQRSFTHSITMINQYPGNVENVIISQNETPQEQRETSYHQHIRNSNRINRRRQQQQIEECNRAMQVTVFCLIFFVFVFYAGNNKE